MSSSSMGNSLGNYFASNSNLYQQFCNQFSTYDPGHNGIPLEGFQQMCQDAQSSGNSQLAQIDMLICSNSSIFNQLSNLSTSENASDGVSRVSLQDIYGLIGQHPTSSNYAGYYNNPQNYYPTQTYYPDYYQGRHNSQSYPLGYYPTQSYYPNYYYPSGYPSQSYYPSYNTPSYGDSSNPYSSYYNSAPAYNYPAYNQQQYGTGAYPDLNSLLNAARSLGIL